MPPRSQRALGIAAASLLAACSPGSGSPNTPTVGPSTSSEGLTVGTEPQRAVTLSEPTLDGALRWGVVPVVSGVGRGQSAPLHHPLNLARKGR